MTLPNFKDMYKSKCMHYFVSRSKVVNGANFNTENHELHGSSQRPCLINIWPVHRGQTIPQAFIMGGFLSKRLDDPPLS